MTGMPHGSLPGWTVVVQEDYSAPLARSDSSGATVESVYAGHRAFHGFPDTSTNGTYDKTPRTVYQQMFDGADCLVLDCHHDPASGRFLVASVVPGGYDHHQRYGKWTIRFRAPGDVGLDYKFIAQLFWPGSNVYGDGEWDIVENVIGSTADLQINPHTATLAHASHPNGTPAVGLNLLDWHTADTEWTPAGVTISMDGAVVRTLTPGSVAIPPGTFRVEQRAETFPSTKGSPPPATTSRARVYIDWVKQYTYTPAVSGP
jgi:hypothetical protein